MGRLDIFQGCEVISAYQTLLNAFFTKQQQRCITTPTSWSTDFHKIETPAIQRVLHIPYASLFIKCFLPVRL